MFERNTFKASSTLAIKRAALPSWLKNEVDNAGNITVGIPYIRRVAVFDAQNVRQIYHLQFCQ